MEVRGFDVTASKLAQYLNFRKIREKASELKNDYRIYGVCDFPPFQYQSGQRMSAGQFDENGFVGAVPFAAPSIARSGRFHGFVHNAGRREPEFDKQYLNTKMVKLQALS